MPFDAINKLKVLFGVNSVIPTLLTVSPVEDKIETPVAPTPPPCLQLSKYWLDALLFWEGFKPYRYLDSKGFWTIGIGALLGDKPAAIQEPDGSWVPTNDPRALTNASAISKLGQSVYNNIMSGAATDPDLYKAPGPNGGGRNGDSAAPGSGSTPMTLARANEVKNQYIPEFVVIARNGIGHDSFDRLPYAVQCVLVVMTFQLGYKIGNFKLMKAALAKNPPDFKKAAAEMKNSDWWKDSQPDRREILQTIMSSGGTVIPAKTPNGRHKFTNVQTAKVNPCGSRPTTTERPFLPTIPEIIEIVGLSGGPIM